MTSIKALRVACVLLAGMVIFSCSGDSGGNSGNKPEVDKGNQKITVDKTNDGHEVLVFEEGYLDNVLIRIDTTEINDSSFSGTAIFKFARPEDIPNVGDIIASQPTTNAPNGFLLKVLGVSTVNENTAIEYRFASLEEAIENGDIEVDVKYDFDENGNLIKITQKESIDKLDGKGPLKKVAAKQITNSVKINDNITVEAITEYSVTLHASYKFRWFKADLVSVYIKPNMDLTLKTTATGDVNFTNLKRIYDLELPPVCFWIVCFTNSTYLDLKTAGNAKIDALNEITTNLSGKYGFDYSGSYSLISETNPPNFNLHMEQSVAGNLQVGTLIGFKSLLYGFTGFSVDVGPVFEFNGDKNFAGSRDFTENGFERDNAKVNLDLLFELGIGAEFLWIKRRWPIEISRTNVKNSKLLPSFDEPQIVFSNDNKFISVVSAIKKEDLGFRVKKYGICLEQTKDDCINGNGNRKIFDEGVREINKKYTFIATFENIDNKISYRIIPFVESGVGTYYDKAIEIPASSSNSGIDNDIPVPYGDETYETVKIGTQTWIARNLNYNAPGSRCYNDDPANCAKYGRLYDWVTAMSLESSCYSTSCASQISAKHKGICPVGWHIPSHAEWTVLTDFVGENSAKKLKAKDGGWPKGSGGGPNGVSWSYDYNGTDDY